MNNKTLGVFWPVNLGKYELHFQKETLYSKSKIRMRVVKKDAPG